MYCGNNRNSPQLRLRGQTIGDRYRCLKKGIGVGKYLLPLDPDYELDYIPIDNRRIYCGRDLVLPDGYDIMGNNGMCFKIGVGVGRAIKAKKKKSKRKSPKKKSKKKKQTRRKSK